MNRIASFLAACLLVLWGAGSAEAKDYRDDPKTSPRGLGLEFARAWRAGDEAEMTFIAQQSIFWGHLDPYVVATGLFEAHVQAMTEEPPRRTDDLDAARAFAEHVSGCRWNADLRAVVERWSRLDAAGLRRQAALLQMRNRVERESAALNSEQKEQLLSDALELCGDDRSDLLVAIVRYSVPYLLESLGRSKDVIAACETAAESLAAVPWPAAHARVFWAAGLRSYRLGDVSAALSFWRRQLAVLEAVDEVGNMSHALRQIAEAHEALGEYASARHYAERAYEVGLRDDSGFTPVLGLLMAARVQALTGDFAGALPRLEEARRLFRDPCRSQTGEAAALMETGRIWSRMGLHERAVRTLEEAVNVVDGVPPARMDRAEIRSALGDALAEAGRLEDAVNVQEEAWRVLEDSGDRPASAKALGRLGALQLRRGASTSAEDTLGRALAAMESMGDRAGAARARADLARAHAARGDYVGACELAKRAARETSDLGDRLGWVRALAQVADLERRTGDPRAALGDAWTAIDTARTLGIGFGEEDAAGLRRDVLAAADVGMLGAGELASVGAAREAAEDAYRFAESSRGLLLAQGILNRESLLAARVPSEVREADSRARSLVAGLYRRLTELASRTESDGGAVAETRKELDRAYAALADAAARMQREARAVGDVVYPNAAPLKDVEASLSKDTALVLYHLTDERAFAVVVTRGGLRLIDLGGSARIAQATQDYADMVSVDGSRDGRRAAALYEMLLRPLEPETLGRRRIVVSPDGPLTFLPFEALVRADGARRERVLERWEVSYTPSATVRVLLLARATSAAGTGIVALGDPVYPSERAPVAPHDQRFGRLRRLSGTAREVGSIGGLFSDSVRRMLVRDDATATHLADALRAVPGRLAALHLACHGHVDAERPRLTGLVLTGGEVLSVDDVYRMTAPADLVVLSGCDTGRGAILRGEGAMGLVRAFLSAGASRVICSDWAVSDEATQALMVAFYRRLCVDRLAPSEALRAAKLEMLRAGGPAAHPAHWAAFVLWGE